MGRQHSRNLDLLRSIAVLLVFSAHLIGSATSHNPGSLGRFGVVIFFVHTSYVLMASLAALAARESSAWTISAMFWTRRWFRIYPLSIVCVLLVPVLQIPMYPGQAYTWFGMRAFCSNLALTQTLTYDPSILAPLWSLPLEVEMYCILPFAYFAIKKPRYRSILLWIVAVGATLVPHFIGRLAVLRFAPCFMSGVLAYDLRGVIPRKLPAWCWPAFIVVAIGLFGPFDNVPLTDPHKLWKAWLLSLFLAFAFLCTRELNAPALNRIFAQIAQYSYGIYLTHIIIFWLVLDVMHSYSFWQKSIALVLGSSLLPVLLYHKIEEPMIRFGSRIATRLLVEGKPRLTLLPFPALPSAPQPELQETP